MARLPSITKKEQVPAQYHNVYDAVAASRGGVHGPFSMLMHCPPLAAHFVTLGGYVRFEGELDKRVRALAAMVVAREFDTMYVWGAQAGSSRRLGTPESTITAVREGHSRGVPPEDAQIIDFTRELIRRHRVSDETMAALQKRFGNFQLVELTGSIGYYSMLCMTANACELETGQGADVLPVDIKK